MRCCALGTGGGHVTGIPSTRRAEAPLIVPIVIDRSPGDAPAPQGRQRQSARRTGRRTSRPVSCPLRPLYVLRFMSSAKPTCSIQLAAFASSSYSSFAMTTVLLRTYRVPQRGPGTRLGCGTWCVAEQNRRHAEPRIQAKPKDPVACIWRVVSRQVGFAERHTRPHSKISSGR